MKPPSLTRQHHCEKPCGCVTAGHDVPYGHFCLISSLEQEKTTSCSVEPYGCANWPLSCHFILAMEVFPNMPERKLSEDPGLVSKPRSIQSRFILMEGGTVLCAVLLMTGALALSVLIRSQFDSGVKHLQRQIALNSRIHEAFDGTILSFWRYYGSNDANLLQQYRSHASGLRQLARLSDDTSNADEGQQSTKNLTQLETAILDLTDQVAAEPPGKSASQKILAEIPKHELAVREALSARAQEQFEQLGRATDHLAFLTRALRAVLLALGLFPVLVMLWFLRAHQQHIWNPLERLHHMVLEVRRGNLGVIGAVPATMELGSITSAFLKMSAELREMRNSLEEKVRNRSLQAEAAQKDLLRAAKLASLGQLVAGVAHEINNPLTSILGFSEILLANDKFSDNVRNQLRTMRDEALRLKHLVANLSQFARRTPQHLHRVDLRTIPDRLLELRSYQLAANNVRVDYRRPDTPVWVKGDRDALLQMMLQLVLNAEHAIRDGRESGQIRLVCAISGVHALLSVADNGCGMNAEMREHIFDPFFTTRPSRHVTGLGLSVCHGIVEQHGGEITVESELNAGAIFRIRLPLSIKESNIDTSSAGRTEEMHAQVTKNLRDPLVDSGRILVIDDEARILSLIAEALRMPEGKLVTLQDSTQFESALNDGPFDAVLCDFKMPGRDGLSLLRELRAGHPDLAQRFVLMTGNLADADRAAAELEGVPLLEKPFTLDRLREVLNQLRVRIG